MYQESFNTEILQSLTGVNKTVTHIMVITTHTLATIVSDIRVALLDQFP